ncbi:MAG: serine/threonine protein kinase [Anaerolineae bacterium]|nr:serine/threonine protein kinase [Anaerolineae bacterium]
MGEEFSQTLGKYQILAEIGRGSFATVYKALDPELQREIALKVLDPRLACDEVFVQRFLREARSAANLQHPNIVVVHEVGEVEGTYFIAMAYLPGLPLVELIANEAPVTVERAIELLSPIAEALDYAHGQGFIHRDVKPSNIILDARGQPVLTDFGLVRAGDVSSLSSLGTPIGTPYYMAPEQASGEPVNRRVDLYSLGVVLFEMLTRGVPFQADTPVAVLYQHVHEIPPDLSTLDLGIPVPVAQVVKQALAKDASSRYPSGKVLIAALQNALTEQPGTPPVEPTRSREPAPPTGPSPPVARTGRVPLWPLLGALASVLLIGIILGWYVFPVQWYDVDPSDLRQEHKEAYISMLADSYTLNTNVALARQRVAGWDPKDLRQVIAQLKATVSDGAQVQRLDNLAAALGVRVEPVIPEPAAQPTAASMLVRRLAPTLGIVLAAVLVIAGVMVGLSVLRERRVRR